MKNRLYPSRHDTYYGEVVKKKLMKRGHYQRLLRITLLLILIVLGLKVNAQNEAVVIGTATTKGYNYPFHNGYNSRQTYTHTWEETLYTHAELGEAGRIDSISFYCQDARAMNETSLIVYLAHTNKSSFANNTDWTPQSQLTLVYSGAYSHQNRNGWHHIKLDTPFEYDGESNLSLVVFCWRTTYNASLTYRYSACSGNKCMYYTSGSGSYYFNTHPGTNAGTRKSERANVRFSINRCHCNPPENLKLNHYNAAGVELSWSPVANSTEYVVDVTNQDGTPYNSYNVTDTMAIIPGLNCDATYTVAVYAKYSCHGVAMQSIPSYFVITPSGNPINTINAADLCAGNCDNIRIGIDNNFEVTLSSNQSTLSVSERAFLPDGVYCDPYGCSYRSHLTFSDYPSDAQIRNANDINYVMLNMEHSYIGDLYINITCPNGQKADILRYSGYAEGSQISPCISDLSSDRIGWINPPTNSSSLLQVRRTFLGIPIDQTDNNKCDSTKDANNPGTGWDYCWSNNTTIGYEYAPGDGRIYREANRDPYLNSFKPSDLENKTNFYHPDESFNSLVGCPLNGDWYIEVIDAWSDDNGYLFKWELALTPELLPTTATMYKIDSTSVTGPWISTINDSTYQLCSPLLEEDFVAEYTLKVFDVRGCEYDSTFNITIHTPKRTQITENIPEYEMPHSFNGKVFTKEVTDTIFRFDIGEPCDSLVIYTLHILHYADSLENHTICRDALPFSLRGHTIIDDGDAHTTPYTITWNDTIHRTPIDTIIHVTLTINPTFHFAERDTICRNIHNYNWHDINTNILPIAANTPYSINKQYSSSLGCDSSYTMALVVRDTHRTELTQIVCDQYIWQSNTYTESCTPTFTTNNQWGCDSISILSLTVNKTTHSIIKDTVVENELPHNFNGQSFSTAVNNQEITISNAKGCDSIITYSLFIHPNLTSTQEQSICDNALPYTWEDMTFTSAGNQTKTRIAHTGADSVVTYTLVVNPTFDIPENATICDNNSYSFNGNSYNTTGDYPIHLTSNKGCDSLVTLHLTVNARSFTTIYDTILENNLPRSYNGHTYTTDVTNETIILTNAKGCDSIITYNLFVHRNVSSSQEQTICDDALPYTWEDMTFTAAGTQTKTRIAHTGADSVVTYTLIVNPTFDIPENATICDNDSYSFNGNNYNTTGDYPIHLTSIKGCDSLVTLHLTVNARSFTTIYDTILENNLPKTYNGNTYTTDVTNETIILTNAKGCDSIITYNLFVHRNVTSSQEQTICDDALPYSWEDMTFTTAGTQTKTRIAHTGADSVVTYTLVVNPTFDIPENATICDNDSYSFNGNSYNTTGDYPVHLTSIKGCDSLITLHLTVNARSYSTIYDTILENNLPRSYNGHTYTTDVTNETITLTNAKGCDSIITYSLFVHRNVFSSQEQTICDDALPYTWEDMTFTAAGTQTKTRIAHTGADSVVTYTLIVLPTYNFTDNATICDNETYLYNGNSYNTAGEYPVHLISINGCDSLRTLNLVVNSTYDIAIDQTICDNETYSFNGNSYTTTGHYQVHLTSINHCDSLVTLNLQVNETSSFEQFDTIYVGDSYVWEGEDYTISGTYQKNYLNQFHCDSIRILHLKINGRTDVDSTICSNQLPITWNGVIFTEAGHHDVHLLDHAGVDSLVMMTLHVNNSYNIHEDLTLCEISNSYDWKDTTFLSGTISGEYTIRRLTAESCDSIMSLSLTINNRSYNTVFDTILENNLPRTYNGNTYTTDVSNETIILPNVKGCDSIITYSLFIHRNVTSSQEQTICDDALPYTWEDMTFTTAGTQTKTRIAHTGADSVVTYTLSVNLTFDITENATICDNDSYGFNGNSYNTSGDYPIHLTSIKGCDSLVTLHLMVNPTYAVDVFDTICDNNTYNFNSNEYSTTGIYPVHLNTIHNCDSLATLHLTINTRSYTTVYDTILENNLPRTYNGHTFTTDVTNETIILTNAKGCDSIITYSLFVHRNVTSSQEQAICNNELPYTWEDMTFTAAGTQTKTRIAHTGADSVVSYTLSVNPTFDIPENATICDNDSYSFNGNSYNSSGDYPVHLTSIKGCDSLVTLHLMVNPTYAVDVFDTICDNNTYNFNGNEYSTTGIYPVHLNTVHNCDSLATLHLTVNTRSNTTVYDTILENNLPRTYNGHTYTTDVTNETIILTNAKGCDSTITYSLFVHRNVTSSQEQAICNNELPYTWEDMTFTAAGTQTKTRIAHTGADSVVTYTLIVNPTFDIPENATICDNDSYSFNGNSYNTTGDYPIHLTSIKGCDSLVTLHLTVNTRSYTTIYDTILENNLPRTYNGHTYTSDVTNETIILTNAKGCDSIITYSLFVHRNVTSSQEQAICDNALPYTWEDMTFTTAGTQTKTRIAHTGADSVVTYTLMVNPTFDIHEDATICDNDSYSFNGNNYNTMGAFPVHLTSINGCDSLVTLHLMVNPTYAVDVFDTICDNNTYNFNGNEYSTTGTYPVHLNTIDNCDSLATLHLTINTRSYTTVYDTILENNLPRTYNGHTYTSDVTNETIILTNAKGCDSIITYSLFVHRNVTSSQEQTICDDALPYTWEDMTFTAAGTQTKTRIARTGADSVVTYTLIVNPTFDIHEDASICDNDSYSFNGNSYTATGYYPIHLTSIKGCDSLVTLHLIVNTRSYTIVYDTILENNLPRTYNGHTYTTDVTNETIILTNAKGCDSIITYSLFVHRNVTSTQEQTICDNELPYTWEDMTFTTAGTQTKTRIAHTGADSVVTYTLVVNPTYDITELAAICDDTTYDFNGETYHTNGLYPIHLVSIAGCDSLITLNLIVNPTYQFEGDVTICENSEYIFNGESYNTTGSYHSHLSSVHGCDSLTILNLTVNPNTYNTIFDTIIENNLPHTFNEISFTTDITNHTITLSNANGCDSIISYNLFVHRNVFESQFDTICENAFPHTWNGLTFSQPGMQTVTYTAHTGADSTVSYNLSTYPTFNMVETYDICLGDTFYYHDNNYDTTGSYSIQLESVHYCDSNINLKLIVHPTYIVNFYDTIYDGDLYRWYDTTLANSGQYQTTLTSQYGCDSTLVLYLQVLHKTYVDSAVCENYLPIIWNGVTFNNASTKETHLIDQNGLDSLVVMTVSILQTSTGYDQLVGCDSVVWNGEIFTEHYKVDDTLINRYGCDSVVHYDINIINTIITDLNGQFCEGSYYTYHENHLRVPGTYLDTLTAASGCDSVTRLTLIELHPQEIEISNSFTCNPAHHSIGAVNEANYYYWTATPDDPTLDGQENNRYIEVNPNVTTTYTLWCDYDEITTCPSTDSIQVGRIPTVEANIVVNPSHLTYENLELKATDRSIGSDTRTWYINGEQQNDTSMSIIYQSDPYTDSVIVMLEASNELCADSATVVVPLLKYSLWFPNTFTPEQATNNRFMGVGTGIRSYEIWIYSREGILMYHGTSMTEGWDGNCDGTKCEPAAYVWRCRFLNEVSDGYKNITGTVLLVR